MFYIIYNINNQYNIYTNKPHTSNLHITTLIAGVRQQLYGFISKNYHCRTNARCFFDPPMDS